MNSSRAAPLTAKRGKLAVKFVIPVSLLMIVISILLTWFVTKIGRNALDDALQGRVKSLAQNLAYNSELGILTGQKQMLQDLSSGILREEDIAYVLVLDENNSPLTILEKPEYAGVVKEMQPETQEVSLSKTVQTDVVTRRISLTEQKKEIGEVSVPVFTVKIQQSREEIGLHALNPTAGESEEKRLIGTVKIGFSTHRIDTTIDRFILIIVACSSIFILLIALVVGFTIYRVVIVPSQRLVHSMQKVQSGELSTQVAISSNDEIGQLADSFNRMAVSLKEAHDNLEQKVQERTQDLEAFSYSVSHDLRAPLRHIHGFADLLSKNASAALDEKGRRYLNTISQSAGKMSKLIDDLLFFSRMGRTDIRKQRVSIQKLVEDVINEHLEETANRRIRWQIAVLPEVHADPALLQQVIINLISNALKYTRTRPEAVIEIGHRMTDTEHLFFVRDNGVGFDMNYVDKLFGVFQRLHSNEEFEGTGIGLANIRRIVQRHGGKAWAEGAVNAGATFYFSLPKMEIHHDLLEKNSTGGRRPE